MFKPIDTVDNLAGIFSNSRSLNGFWTGLDSSYLLTQYMLISLIDSASESVSIYAYFR